MTEEELRLLLQAQGWNLFTRKRGERGYFYAQKWRLGEIYISSQSNLPAITPERVLAKIQKASGQR